MTHHSPSDLGQPVPGSQIVQWEHIKTSKAKIRRARLGKGGDGALSLPSPRSFFAFLITERLSITISEPGTGQIWVRVLLIVKSKFLANQILGCDTPSDFFALRSSDIISRETSGGVAKCRVSSYRLISVHYKLRVDKNVHLVCL